MPLTFSVLSLGASNAATTLTGYKVSASFCIVAVALHVGIGEEAPDPELAQMLRNLIERSAEIAATDHTPADILRRMHDEAARTGRYYSGVVICGHRGLISLARSGLVSAHAVTNVLTEVTGPQILTGAPVPLLTAALGTPVFGTPQVIAADPGQWLAVFVGGSPANDQVDALRSRPAAAQYPVARGGLVIFVRAATSYEPTTAPMIRPKTTGAA
jgi:hypothetical protein